MVSGRRIPQRVRVRWPVVLITARGVIVAETRDLSSDGAFIQCRLPLEPNEKLRLFIMAPDQRPLDFAAEVAWSNPHGTDVDNVPSGMGVRFTKLSNDNRNFLRSALAKYYKRKSSDTGRTT